ncbi:Molybdenum transport system permease protein ModB [compost metagenome]
MEINWTEFFAPVWLSVKIAVITSIIVFILASYVAKLMAGRKFPGYSLLETVLMLPLVLPPTVVGFVLLVILGRRSWIGELYERLTEQTILFTWGAAVIAAVVVAFPLVYRTVKAGFEEVDKDLEDAARAQGASELQVLRYVTLPLAGRALAAGFVLGFARGLGEFGATIMVAGNIPGRTQTVPTAIYVAVDGGNMTLAWMWVCSIIVISALMLMFVTVNRIELIPEGRGAQNIKNCINPLFIPWLLEHHEVVTFLNQRDEFQAVNNLGGFFNADADIGFTTGYAAGNRQMAILLRLIPAESGCGNSVQPQLLVQQYTYAGAALTVNQPQAVLL